MFPQIVLIAAVKRFLYNAIKNNTGVVMFSLEAHSSLGRWRPHTAAARVLRVWFCGQRRRVEAQGRQDTELGGGLAWTRPLDGACFSASQERTHPVTHGKNDGHREH